ncbi:hypothetical protein [Bacillus infantis]|uniref:hypothetical protein n=1 Tax=Bacillus infantis TaxID=324767 RepID=UPI002E892A07|nr:hypothetical protein [Bacillus infantis]
MSYSHHHYPRCSSCGGYHNDHFDRNHHYHPHPHSHPDKHSCSCHHDIHHSQAADSFLCDDRFQIRLGGLQGNLAFRLRQLVDCKVKMQLECGSSCEEILAKICFVGSNFVEVKVIEVLGNTEEEEDPEEEEEEEEEEAEEKPKKKKKKNTFRIVPMEDLKWVEFKERKCDCGHC